MDWRNLSQTVLGLVKQAATNPSVQQAGISLLQGVGQHILSHADEPERMKRLGNTLKQAAPVLVGAIVKNTSAETTVPKSVVNQVDEVVRGDSPGG